MAETDDKQQTTTAETLTGQKLEDFLAQARKLRATELDKEKPLRDAFIADLAMECGEQWDDRIKAAREQSNRPVLTFNREHTFVQKVANIARENKPQIKYIPTEDSDKETAEVYEGLARHIQYDSSAAEAYETAIEYAAAGGFGFYGLTSRYCDDERDPWAQEVIVETIPDPLSVIGILFPEIFGYEPEFAFHDSVLSKEAYQSRFPKSELATLKWDDALSKGALTSEDQYVVTKYWWVERKAEVIEHEDGRKRTLYVPTVKSCLTNGIEILGDGIDTWGGKSIPLFAVTGKKRIKQGKPYLFSVIRFQHDAQKLLNGYKTRIAETLSAAPISPWIAAEGQIEGHERQWANSATTTGVLEYKPQSIGGEVLGPPQRQVYEPPIAALVNASQLEVDDMKATTGIFDASLGARSNEQSGKAIFARQQEADTVNAHFEDNLARSFAKSGKELATVLPIYYDTQRIVRILGPDEKPKLVSVNGPQQPKIGGEGVAKFDIVVTMGRAFSTKRVESTDMMGQVMQSAPQTFPMWADIFFENSDAAGSDRIAERFKKMLPPQLQDAKEGEAPIPPQVQQKLAQADQLAQQHEQLVQQNHQLMDALEQKQVEQQAKSQLELEKLDRQTAIEQARISLEQQRLDWEIRKHMMTLDSQETQTLVKVEADLAKVGMQADVNAMAQQAEQGAQQMAEEA